MSVAGRMEREWVVQTRHRGLRACAHGTLQETTRERTGTDSQIAVL